MHRADSNEHCNIGRSGIGSGPHSRGRLRLFQDPSLQEMLRIRKGLLQGRRDLPLLHQKGAVIRSGDRLVFPIILPPHRYGSSGYSVFCGGSPRAALPLHCPSSRPRLYVRTPLRGPDGHHPPLCTSGRSGTSNPHPLNRPIPCRV